jgi:hypothetical protein
MRMRALWYWNANDILCTVSGYVRAQYNVATHLSGMSLISMSLAKVPDWRQVCPPFDNFEFELRYDALDVAPALIDSVRAVKTGKNLRRNPIELCLFQKIPRVELETGSKT